MSTENLEKLREKYPQYRDIPDQELAQKIVAKYPQYNDILGDVASGKGIQQPAEEDTSPVSSPTTFAGKAADIVKTGLKYPMGLPASVENVSEAVSSGSPVDAYYELMPQFEKLSAKVKSAKTNAIGNVLRETATKYPATRGALAAIADLVLDLVPFEPSSFAAPLAPVAARASGVKIPFKNPTTIETALEKTATNLGEEGLTQEGVGAAAKKSYVNRVARPLELFTKEPEAPKAATSAQDVFNPKFKSVAGQIYPEKVTSEQAGGTVKTAYQRKVKDLLARESKEWNSLSTQHFDKPVKFENTQNYLTSVLQAEGRPTALDQLNPALRKAAENTANPEQTAQSLLKVGMNPGDASRIIQNLSGDQVSELQNLQRGYSTIQKLWDIVQGEANFGQVKTLRSQLGKMIKWEQRGDELNHILKGAYKSLTEDIGSAAKSGGFQNEVQSAVKSTRDFYDYTAKPSSKIIDKTQYVSDLPNRLIKSNSPERVRELFNEHAFSDPEKRIVRRNVLDELARQSDNDPRKFSKALDKYSPETRKEIFGAQFKLVESIKETAKKLSDAVIASKVKGKAYTREDVLSKTGIALDNLMQRANASELVQELMKDGTPEMARVVSGAFGKEGTKLVRRGIINKIIEQSRTRMPNGPYRIKYQDLATNLKKLDDSFISEMFGDDANTLRALKDSSQYFKEEMSKNTYTPYRPFGTRAFLYLYELYKRYRLPDKTFNLIKASFGNKTAQKIIPQKPNFRPTSDFSKGLGLSQVVQNALKED